MFAIARSELRMLVRNRLVAACAVLLPLGLAAVFLFQGLGSSGVFAAVLQITVIVGMGVYVTATTTLAARRQTLFLKRLRSGAASDATIIGGLVAPIVVVNIVQVFVVLGALAAVTSWPVNPWLVVIAVLVIEALLAALAIATAGVTNSPEHAQVTTLPVFFAVIGISVWTMFSGPDAPAPVEWGQRLLPGGATTELVVLGWTGGDLSAVPLLVGISVAWVVVAVLVARSMFRWEPRA
ncbi:ABC transporter permease [Antiquaquibacter soli]|uniref:ABC transporter permease n=1 Tax=Antiquaquibacter soli TaxID=3064523 RepID=A0ABT9BK59_9MICO|nr:ABC transporter permease [Protaetiibacter sp. WY-16]MDO7881399.1 ABC transporter permease [Protaetiibacter sp. WY-16]